VTTRKEPEPELELANEESKKLRREAAARLFAEDWWPLWLVFWWIAFRDPDRIEDSWRAEKRFAQRDVLSKILSDILRDTDPKGTLLKALRSGAIKAYAAGKAVRRKFWHEFPDRGGWPNVTFITFKRRDVLAKWKDDKRKPPRQLSAKHAADLLVQYRNTTATPTRAGFVREWAPQFRRGATSTLRKAFDLHMNGRKRGRPSNKKPGVADKPQVSDTN
jgi:hypothetical protein